MEAQVEAENRTGAPGRETASITMPVYVDRYIDATESDRTAEQPTLIRREFGDTTVGKCITEMIAAWEARLT